MIHSGKVLRVRIRSALFGLLAERCWMNGTQAAKRQTPYKYYRWPVPCQTMRANRQAGQHQGRGPSNFGTHAAEGEQDAPADRDGLWRVLPLWPRRQTRITFADCLRGDAFSVSKVLRGCAREHLRLVILPIKLHSRRVQPIDAVPLKMPFPGPQFLEGQ